jgi:hypothetical protein
VELKKVEDSIGVVILVVQIGEGAGWEVTEAFPFPFSLFIDARHS